MSQISLQSALDRINGSLQKERQAGHEDLKRILRQCRSNPRAVVEVPLQGNHTLFEALADNVANERTAYFKSSKSTTKTAASTTFSRLAAASAAYRFSIEVCGKSLSWSKIRACLEHLTDTFTDDQNGICEPIALDNAKTINEILSYRPHLEHIPAKLWRSLCRFATSYLDQLSSLSANGNISSSGSRTVVNRNSSASNSLGGSQSSQVRRMNSSTQKHLLAEFARMLKYLASSTAVPVYTLADLLIASLLRALSHVSIPGSPEVDMLAALNHVLTCSDTEATPLIKQNTPELLRIIELLWTRLPGRLVALRDELLNALILLLPFIRAEAETYRADDTDAELLPHVRSIADHVFTEYSGRALKDLLSVDDVRLSTNPVIDTFHLPILALASDSDDAYRNWSMLLLTVQMFDTTKVGNRALSSPNTEERLSKRPRTDSRCAALIRFSKGPGLTKTIAGLQLIMLNCQVIDLDAEELADLVHHLGPLLNDERQAVAAWGSLALASCASQKHAKSEHLSAIWNEAWTSSTRGISSPGICRTACHLLTMLHTFRLVSSRLFSSFASSMRDTLDLHGPASCDESAVGLVLALLKYAQSARQAIFEPLASASINWLFRTWNPGSCDAQDLFYIPQSLLLQDVIGLVSTSLQELNVEVDPWLSRKNDLVHCWAHHESVRDILSYLLLSYPYSNCVSPAPPTTTINKVPNKPKAGDHVVDQLMQHCQKHLARILSQWIQPETLQATASGTSFVKSSILLLRLCNWIEAASVFTAGTVTKDSGAIMTAMTKYLATSECHPAKTEMFLDISLTTLYHVDGSTQNRTVLLLDSKWYSQIYSLLPLSEASDLSQSIIDDDDLAMGDDSDFESAPRKSTNGNSRQASQNVTIATPKDMSRTVCGRLYTKLMSGLAEGEGHPLEPFIEELQSMTSDEKVAGRDIICRIAELGAGLTAESAFEILDHLCEEVLQRSYAQSRSGLAKTFVVRFWAMCYDQWIFTEHSELEGVSVDIYDDCLHSLSDQTLTLEAQVILSNILVKIWQHNDNFAQHDQHAQADAELSPSPRSAVIRLISDGRLLAKYCLAEKIPVVFNSYAVPLHDALYDDLEKGLPNNADSVDDIAIRIAFLAGLGAECKSLLRKATWHIFDAAGQVPACIGHAVRAIQRIRQAHRFQNETAVFRLFCSQLAYTWQTDRSLSAMPFSVFGYESLQQLLKDNLAEVVAQCYLFEKVADLVLIKDELQLEEPEMIRESFITTFTYAVAHDVSQTPQNQHLANKEKNLRELFSKDELVSLIKQSLPYITAKIVLATHVDASLERVLDKRSHMEHASHSLARMKSFAQDARDFTVLLQPSFRVKHLFEFLERLARRVGLKSQDLFAGPLFVIIIRCLFDSMNECLGSLHTRSIVQKIRLVCALGDKALEQRYPADMLVRNLRPSLEDLISADDTAGIMYHVFDRGKQAMAAKSENISGVLSSALLTADTLKRACSKPSIELNSQSQLTRTNMNKLHTWLGEYVATLEPEVHDRHKAAFQVISSSFGDILYPAEFRRDTKASTYLIALLDDSKSSRPLMEESDRSELIRTLVGNSTGAPLGDDVLQKHSSASRYAAGIWRAVKTLPLPSEVSQWLGRALGRSYSMLGPAQARRMIPLDDSDSFARPKSSAQAVQTSRYIIVRKLTELLASQSPKTASIAERALRSAIDAFRVAGDVEAIQALLPDHIFLALDASITQSSAKWKLKDDHNALASPLDRSSSGIVSLVEKVIQLSPTEPISGSILPAVRGIESFAEAVLGPLCHLALYGGDDAAVSARQSLSDTIAHTFRGEASTSQTKHTISVLLYLLRQPAEKEGTRMERLQWLEIDYLAAARCAVRCNMPKHALLLAEIAPRAVQHTRSSRRSSSQASPGHADIPHDLLLSIFDIIDDPDSFYAVERAPSLDNILKRVDREADPYKSLVLHSACLDASKRSGEEADVEHSTSTLSALGSMNMNALSDILLKQSRTDDIQTSETAIHVSRKLYEWDIQLPESNEMSSATIFGAFQHLSNSSTAYTLQSCLVQPVTQALGKLSCADLTRERATSALHALALVSDIQMLADCTSASSALALQTEFASLQSGWDVGQYAELLDLVSNRESIFGTFRRNDALQQDLKISLRDGLLLEVRAVLQTAKAYRDLGGKQGSLTAATYLNRLIPQCVTHGLQIQASTVRELASVLWLQDEPEASIQMLQSLVSDHHQKQDIPVDRAGLLSQLGHELAEARLEKPGDIIDKYLKPALQSLSKSSSSEEAANVYFEFASFCDQQLQSADNEEEFKNLIALKAGKEKEQEELRELDKRLSDKNERHEVRRRYNKAKQWLDLDNQEYHRMKKVRDELVTQALANYLRALAVSDKYDAYVVRFFALWLDHDDSNEAQMAVEQSLKDVPSWKFVTLLNQIMSRLQATDDHFQELLAGLVSRICGEHPYHSIYHLFASVNVKVGPNDTAAKLRKSAAERIAHTLKASKKTGELVGNVWTANGLYHNLASAKVDTGRTMKFSIQQVPAAREMNKRIPPMHIPPATLSLKLRPRADYKDVPFIARFREELSIASGLSAPKVVTARSSDGKDYKMLFKGGNDDLRQDAIMEQVFSSVSSMLRNHTDTRRRNLHIRTYVVLPLTHTSGIIEFVPNSLPLHDFVVPAHQRYHPSDLHPDKARSEIKKAQDLPRDARLKAYQNVTAKYSPVLRHFFFERFESPQLWFEKRTAYARSTAAISILGHVLGLGDRHCHNILLDELSGEVIHIDLGVAFEMGRVLPVPEVVPFRLTRDIVDGMGITGVEGVFRRCCEFTLQALREEKGGIMTLLNVLRYDPLYSWTVSPLRAKRMMDESGAKTGKEGKEEGPAEAERALAVVEKKLGRALSVKATVSELVQVAGDERNLAVLFAGWAAYS
ncbi:hypothetical protein KVT40_000052 [Elsinoe batatas]|uniref:Serine/threonine-protein kinase Tel1 n=1 Tax=Elsinoe batatas TaxID=2601811 RepID=A0A8K0L8J5_9PEZI|nr:hypothetical protein KVT40_000052 [Elsinoe batatas]